MRADRLLAELILLQARGRMTAADIAVELEVTERTVYRDMYALQVAGVPLVAERGRAGGYSLFGDWRSDATGLTARELEALLIASVSSPETRASSTSVTAAAKLAAMLPVREADELRQLRRRIHVVLGDESAVSRTVGAVLVAALRGSYVVSLVLRRAQARRVEHLAHPIGLVVDGRDWYLIWHAGDGRPRVDGLEGILEVEVTPEPAVDPGPVDLADVWQTWQEARRGPAYRAVVRIDDRLLPRWRMLHSVLSEHLGESGTEVVTGFGSIIEARAAVLPWGGAIEVLFPPALRRSVADFAQQAAAIYADH